MTILDYRQWMQQPLVWTERVRSKALVWTPRLWLVYQRPLGATAPLA